MAALVAAAPATASAAAFVVTSVLDAAQDAPGTACAATVDQGVRCTLRAAVQASNATPEADTIRLAAGTYTLTIDPPDDDAHPAATGDLDVAGTLTITGADAAAGRPTSVIDAGGRSRHFQVAPGAALRLTGIALQGGNANEEFQSGTCADAGGAVCGPVALDGCVIRGSTAAIGGAIATLSGTLEIVNSTLDGNTSAPGNETITVGGAIAATGGATVTVSGSTISGNSASEIGSRGGGIWLSGAGAVTLRNSTISGNEAQAEGGGIHVAALAGGPITLNNVTLAANTAAAGGGLSRDGAPAPEVVVSNTLLAGNAPDDCTGALALQGTNLVERAGSGCERQGDREGNPRIAGLADNGGPTQTHALPPEGRSVSGALNAGSPAAPGTAGACETTDQRGVPRPQSGFQGGRQPGPSVCDIGAFELEDDRDADGVPDRTDDCIDTRNVDQVDTDRDGLGDACDACPTVQNKRDGGDDDCDGVANDVDCCPATPETNPATPGECSAGETPACIAADGCSVSESCPCAGRYCNDTTRCPCPGGGGLLAWRTRDEWRSCIRRALGRRAARRCTPDLPDCPLRFPGDHDGIADDVDNCLRRFNPKQCDMDGDGKGDPCDADVDGDGIANVRDRCPVDAPEEGKANIDADGDKLPGECDNCPKTRNDDQRDRDGDGIGDACDNCKLIRTDDREDSDGDGIGDACDCCPDTAEGARGVECDGCAFFDTRDGRCNRGNCQ